MNVIGLYAGVGAGKTTVAQLFAERGALRVDADEIVHQLYGETAVRESILARFGPEAYLSDGKPNRRFLADTVFADPVARADIEQILHPLVREKIRARIESARADNHHAVVLLDVPLLAESPLQVLVTDGVFVDAPLDVREARCQADRQWPPGEVARRDALQIPLSDKRALCRYVVVNDAATLPADLREQVLTIWTDLLGDNDHSA